MKTMKKLLIVILTLSLLAVPTLAGCKKDDKKLLTVATEALFDPFEYIDKQGNYTGFDIELIKLLATKMGYDGIEVKDMQFDAVLGAISTGKCDVAIAAMTINPGRAKSVDFADSYYTGSAQWLVVKKDDTTFTGKTKEELDAQLIGKTIGVAKGQTGEYYVNGGGDFEFTAIKNADCKSYDSMPTAITALKTGKVNCVISDNAVAKEYVEKNPELKLIEVNLTVESYGIAVKKGNTELVTKLNKALKEANADGTYKAIYDKYFA